MLIVCPSCASRYSIEDEKIGETGRMVRCASCKTAFFVTLADDQTGKTAPKRAKATALAGDPVSAGDAAADAQPLDQADLDALFASEMAAAEAGSVASPDNRTPDSAADAAKAAQTDDADATELPAVMRAKAKQQSGKNRGKGGARGRFASGAMMGRHAQALMTHSLRLPLAVAAASVVMLALLLWQREALARVVPQSAGLFAAVGLPVNPRGLAFADVRSSVFKEEDTRFLVVEGRVSNLRNRPAEVPLIAIDVRGENGRSLYQWTTEPPRLRLNGGENLHFRARLATPPEAGRHVEVRFADRPITAQATP